MTPSGIEPATFRLVAQCLDEPTAPPRGPTTTTKTTTTARSRNLCSRPSRHYVLRSFCGVQYAQSDREHCAIAVLLRAPSKHKERRCRNVGATNCADEQSRRQQVSDFSIGLGWAEVRCGAARRGAAGRSLQRVH